MGRKHDLTGRTSSANSDISSYAKTGASRTLVTALDDMTAAQNLVQSGEMIVELDPKLVKPSPVNDRIEGDEASYLSLKNSIKEDGQGTPILVRPGENGTYIVVFGHRRRQAAEDLGINVRAVVREMDESDAIITQGQENTARDNLSFIELAKFAWRLKQRKMPSEDISRALSVDQSMVRRLVQVGREVPEDLVQAIGPANGVGRDRWQALVKALAAKVDYSELISSEAFRSETSDQRFEIVLGSLKAPKPRSTAKKRSWVANASTPVKASISETPRAIQISLSGSPQAREFARFIEANMGELFEQYQLKGGGTG